MTGRLVILAVTIGVAAALIATIVLEPLPLYIWNASASNKFVSGRRDLITIPIPTSIRLQFIDITGPGPITR